MVLSGKWNFDVLRENMIFTFGGKYDFHFWWKIWFYSFGENFNFKVLSGKGNFFGFGEKVILLFFFTKDFEILKKNMILRENDFVVLSEKMISQFCRKMWFYCFRGKWAFCEFYGFGGKMILRFWRKNIILLICWKLMWFRSFGRKYDFLGFTRNMLCEFGSENVVLHFVW